jgi:ketosteroid isomerase-like protein
LHVTEEKIQLVLEVFRAVEERDADALFARYDNDLEFHEAASLPFGGSYYGLAEVRQHALAWQRTWDPFQQAAERRMEPRVIAATQEEVVIRWQQKGVNAAGERLVAPVLAHYRIRGDKVVRAQMFHFDTAAVVRFLSQGPAEPASRSDVQHGQSRDRNIAEAQGRSVREALD